MSKQNLIKTIKLLIVAIVTLTLWLMPVDSFGIDGLTVIQQRMIAIFAFAAVMWILEAVPAWVTSVLIIVLMLFTVSDSAIASLIDVANYPGQTTVNDKGVEQLTGIIGYKDIMSAFADPTVMLFLGGFVLAAMASKFGVDVTLARAILGCFGKSPKVQLLGFMLVTAIFSMFISNTATAAMMLTFLAPVFRELPTHEKGRIALALAIPIGANIGGIGTPIGTPPNGIALGALKDAGINIGFLDWAMVMTPLMIVILLVSWVVLLTIFPFKSKELEIKIEGRAEKNWKTYAVYIVLALTIILWCGEKAFGINSYVVALFPVAAFTALGLASGEDIKGLDWPVLWMVAGGFALGTGMKKSGLAEALVTSIPFSTWNVFAVVIGAGLICWLLSTFISNSASAALMVPILVTVGTGMSEQLAPFGGITTLVVGIALSASFAMALPISTPPNAIAYSTGLVSTKQMAKAGLIVGVLSLTLGYSLLFLFGKSLF